MVTLLVVRPQLLVELLLVVADDGGGQLQDALRRAIVLLETDSSRGLEIPLERQYVTDVRPPERVDALRIIPYNAQVLMCVCEFLRQHVLRAVGILVLVDVDVTPAPLIFLEDVGMPIEQLDRTDRSEEHTSELQSRG